MLKRPNGYLEIVEAFGDIRQFIRSDGTLLPTWENKLTPVELPGPLPLSWDRAVEVHRVRCHTLLVPAMTAALENLELTGAWREVKEYGGCFNFRPQRGSSSKISTHAWGIAIDLNPSTNPLGSQGKIPISVIQAFEDAGFYWGGNFTRPDPMHFQYATGY